MLLTALNLLVPIGVLVAAIDNRVFNAGCGEWLGMYVGVGGFVLSQVVDRQQHPEIARNTLQKKSCLFGSSSSIIFLRTSGLRLPNAVSVRTTWSLEA